MSFNISIQYNASPKNKVGKNISTITELTGTLRAESSIIDPVFLVDSTMANLRLANYCTISAWKRSYFINDIKTVRQGLIELHCHVDVLQSFASEIRQNSAIVKRNENVGNVLMNDGYYKIYQNPYVVMYEFPYGFTAYEWVLAMAGSTN